MTLYDKIKEALETMRASFDEDLIQIHNNYCDAANDMDDFIYSMDEFDEIMSGSTPWEVARAAFFGKEFNPCHKYFYFNGYGNLESLDYIGRNSNDPIDDAAIADYAAENNDDLGSDVIRAILDEYNNYNEED